MNHTNKNQPFKLIVTLFLVSLTMSLIMVSVITSSKTSISYALSSSDGEGSLGKGSGFGAQSTQTGFQHPNNGDPANNPGAFSNIEHPHPPASLNSSSHSSVFNELTSFN